MYKYIIKILMQSNFQKFRFQEKILGETDPDANLLQTKP